MVECHVRWTRARGERREGGREENEESGAGHAVPAGQRASSAPAGQRASSGPAGQRAGGPSACSASTSAAAERRIVRARLEIDPRFVGVHVNKRQVINPAHKAAMIINQNEMVTVNVISLWNGRQENKLELKYTNVKEMTINDAKIEIQKYIITPKIAKWDWQFKMKSVIADVTWNLENAPIKLGSIATVWVKYQQNSSFAKNVFMIVYVNIESSKTIEDLIAELGKRITIPQHLKVLHERKNKNNINRSFLIERTSTMKDFNFGNDSIHIHYDADVAMWESKKQVAATAFAVAGAGVLATYTLLRLTNRKRDDLCAKIGLNPAVTMVLLRSPDHVSVTLDGSPKLFRLPPRVTGGRSVCRRALSLVTNSEAETRSLFRLDQVRLVRKKDKTWIIVLNLPDSKWLPKPTALRAKLSSKGLGMVVADAGISVLALSRRPGQPKEIQQPL